MERETLLREGLLNKFLRYVKVDTASAEGTGKVPSTPGQWDLARMLAEELRTLGLADAAVDDRCFVTATLPSNLNRPAPVGGFLAHLDTFPGVPGKNVKPLVHRNYQGDELRLPGGGTLSPAESPALCRCLGHDLVTSDGTTLLGADDKSGIAAIMEAVCRFLREPETPHGTLKVAFTPDEEVGGGIDLFDVARFGADVAYTLDGGGLGELEAENFHARNYAVTIHGISAHTGDARGKMVNAVHLAAEFVGAFPAAARPETTDGRQGFLHPDQIEGDVERVTIKVLARDFSREGIEQKERILRDLAALLALRHPGAKAEVRETNRYDNMKEVLDRHPKVVQLAEEAIRRAGLEPVHRAIRGGTDGARLSYKGLPTPNLFDGSENVHSRREWASVQWMEKAAETVYQLALLWAGETGR